MTEREEPFLPPREEPFLPPREEPFLPPREDSFLPPREDSFLPQRGGNLRFYSSFLFLINTILCFYYNEIIYGLLFFSLFISSILVHTKDTPFINRIDKFIILCVALYGGYLFLKKIQTRSNPRAKPKKPKKTAFLENKKYLIYTIFTTFLATIYLYVIGYCKKTGCFCEDENEAMYNHCIMHGIGAIGHMIIVIL